MSSFEEQCKLVSWPDWYRPSKWSPAKNKRVARGLHPLGMPLGPQGETCGSCAHLVRAQHGAGTYLKCDRTNMSRSSATDVRAKWRACSLWERNMQ